MLQLQDPIPCRWMCNPVFTRHYSAQVLVQSFEALEEIGFGSSGLSKSDLTSFCMIYATMHNIAYCKMHMQCCAMKQ